MPLEGEHKGSFLCPGPVPVLLLVGTWMTQEAGGGWGRRNAALVLSQRHALPGTALYLAGQGAVTKGTTAGF